jgi:hypothetical protein
LSRRLLSHLTENAGMALCARSSRSSPADLKKLEPA